MSANEIHPVHLHLPVTEIDGCSLHFVHVRCTDPDAPSLLMIHDRPGSFVEYVDVIESLSRDFHVVVPAVPSTWTAGRIGWVLGELMTRLGYHRYSVEGSGTSASIAAELRRLAPSRVVRVFSGE